MKKVTFLFATILLNICVNAQSFTATYTFDSVKTTSGTTDPTPLPTATGMTFGAFTATGTPVNPNAAARFSFANWPTGATNGDNVYTNLTGSLSTSEFYQVTLAPTSGNTMTLTGITFTFGRSSSGVRTYAVRSSADAYAADLPASISPANVNLSVQSGNIFFLNTDFGSTTTQNGSTITLSGTSYTNISTPLTFRFYGWNSEGTTGTFSIDNVVFSGSTALAPLAANFMASVVCFGDSTVFTNTSSGPNPIISNVWDFGDGSPASTLTNPSHLYGASGNYTVTLTVIDNLANTSTTTGSAIVHALPSADFAAPGNNCAGMVQFYDSSATTDGTINGWLWNFGDPASGANNLATIPNPVHNYSAAGTFEVTQVVYSSFGCTDTLMDSVTIFALPVAEFSAPVSICGGPVQFIDSSSVLNGTITGWSWNFGDTASAANNFSTLQNPAHTFTSQGSFTVTEIVYSNHGCADTTTLMISNYIVTAFLPFTQMGDSVYFSGYATGGSSPYSYLLDLGTGGGFNITTPTYMYNYPDGTYTACLLAVDNNGCMDTSCSTFTIMTVGIVTGNFKPSVRISPNPSSDGTFVINIENNAKASISVYNIIGKKIIHKEAAEGKNNIDLSGEANGSYFVTIKTDHEVITKKIIVNK